jgi:hypothetical protein
MQYGFYGIFMVRKFQNRSSRLRILKPKKPKKPKIPKKPKQPKNLKKISKKPRFLPALMATRCNVVTHVEPTESLTITADVLHGDLLLSGFELDIFLVMLMFAVQFVGTAYFARSAHGADTRVGVQKIVFLEQRETTSSIRRS